MSVREESWNQIYDIFIKAGFSEEESDWAADHNLSIRGPKRLEVGRLLKNRRNKVEVVLTVKKKWGWAEAVGYLADARLRTARNQGAEDEMNVFIGDT